MGTNNFRRTATKRRIGAMLVAPVLTAAMAVEGIGPASAAASGGGTVVPVVPADATVFYMNGTAPKPWPTAITDLANAGTEFAELLGAATQALQVGYDAALAPFAQSIALNVSVAQGANNLAAAAAAALAAGTPVVFVGLSQGDIVLSKFESALIAKGVTASQAANITFIRIADPSSPTGLMGRNVDLLLPGVTCIQSPESPFNTVIETHQYDGFADWPVQEWNLLADLNGILGILAFHNLASYSVDLSSLPAQDVTTTINRLGATITSYFIPDTGYLPLLLPLQAAGVNPRILNALQGILKPIIDSAYQPLPLPAVAAAGEKAFLAVANATVAAGVWAVNSIINTRTTMASATAAARKALSGAASHLRAMIAAAAATITKPVAAAATTSVVPAAATSTKAVNRKTQAEATRHPNKDPQRAGVPGNPRSHQPLAAQGHSPAAKTHSAQARRPGGQRAATSAHRAGHK